MNNSTIFGILFIAGSIIILIGMAAEQFLIFSGGVCFILGSMLCRIEMIDLRVEDVE